MEQFSRLNGHQISNLIFAHLKSPPAGPTGGGGILNSLPPHARPLLPRPASVMASALGDWLLFRSRRRKRCLSASRRAILRTCGVTRESNRLAWRVSVREALSSQDFAFL